MLFRAAAAYLGVAGLLGLGWFAVLLVPSWTRQWLLADRGFMAGNIALLVATSMVVAWYFRGAIGSARRFGAQLARAVLLPFVGCVIYLTLWNGYAWARDRAGGAPGNLHDSLVLYYWGLQSAVVASFVTIPYGLVCQIVMKRAFQRWIDPGAGSASARSISPALE